MDNISKDLIRKINQNNLVLIEEIILYGSRTNASLVDRWSDIDLKIVLHEEEKIDQIFIGNLLNGLGKLIGKQTLINEKDIICRLVIEMTNDRNIEMVDLQLTKPSENQIITKQGVEITDTNDEQFWFTLFLAARKFMRRDHLIGTHLLLDNLKLLLEAEMIKRDKIKQTKIHRFGDEENVSALLELSQLKLADKNQIINYLIIIGEKYDQMMLDKIQNYEPKNKYLLKYLKNI